MSSLTTIGVNKNKKGFAPKIAKRKERRPAGAAAAGPLSSKGKDTTEKTSITAESTSMSAVETSLATAPTSITTERVISKASIPQVSSPGTVDAKVEPLTEEELAMNAIAANPKRRRTAATVDESQPDNEAEEDQARTSKKRVPQVISAPSPISAASPMNAPSPIAPLAIERANCAFEQQTGPVLKIERLTPDVRSRLYSSIERQQQPTGSPVTPKQDDDMDYDELLTQDPNDDQTSSKISIPNTSRTLRVRSKPTKESASASSTTRSKPTARSKPAARSKPSAKPKPTVVAASNDTASKRGTKRKDVTTAAAVSIGIGVPSVTSSRETEDQLDYTSESSSEGDDGTYGRRRRGRRRKTREQGLTRKPHKYAYREVENLRTLDDITNDPASSDNLDRPMSLFTKDIDGVVSKVFKEMEIARAEKKKKEQSKTNMNEEELAELKKKEEEEAELEAKRKQIAKEREAEKRKKEQEGRLAESSNAVQVRLVNGQIVLDTDTLTVERTEAEHDYGDGAMEVVEETSMSRKVNSQTYGKRKQSAKWDAVETETFYDCLSQFGTDFEMISMVLEGRTRNQVRQKFNREEKLNPAKVTEYLVKKRKPLDIEKYKKMAGIEELEAVPDDFHEMTIA